ncbi:MAG TPA: bifunctional YncE family protein/alkaline phosphatase family protein [Kribbella sp.]
MRVPHLTAMAAVSALIVGATATAFADPGLLGFGNATVGRQADGSVVTSTGQRVTPAGVTTELTGRPLDEAVRPDRKTATLLNAQGSLLVVVDLASHKVLQNLAVTGQSASFAGVAYSPDGTQLFASAANGAIVRASVGTDGHLSGARAIALPQKSGNPYPGGLAVSPDAKSLYIAMNRDNALGVLDLTTERFVQEIPVGNAPHAVVLKNGKAYVTNQGGRPAKSGDTTVDSAGTPIVADRVTGGPATGTVSVVDLAAAKTVETIPVGRQPTAATLHGNALFVTNTSDDTISVIDTAGKARTQTIDVRPLPHLPGGSEPNGVTFVGNDQLVVTLGRTNALALYRWTGLRGAPAFEGMVPTGWYPTAVLPAADGGYVVANGKGVGALGPADANGGHRVQALIGSVQFVPKPTSKQLGTYTGTVLKNNNLSASTAYDNARKSVAPVPVPQRIGEPSTIKHVFYIIKENRTYDQVLGDAGKGNSQPTLAMFGKDVTPNQHSLVNRFPLMDNYYADGDLSADGHQWAMQANVPDYLEKAFGNFVRSYPFWGGDSMAYLPTGFLWGNARKAGKTVADLGEYIPQSISTSGQAVANPPLPPVGKWSNWYHDAQVLAGEASGQLTVPPHTFQAKADVPGLDPLVVRDYPSYTEGIPDQYRYQMFKQQFAQWQKNNTLPDLTIMQLNADHTAGSSANFPTPRAMVADNDLAVGKIVDEISHSKYWKDSAIFVTEDDSQAGVDHVDGHRTTGYVISPWTTNTGAVDSTYYTQVNMVRTIEQILGLPPMNQMDLAAPPMSSLFTTKPNFAPYDAVVNKVPLDEMNPGSTPPAGSASTSMKIAQPTGIEKQWLDASNAMGFNNPNTPPDATDRNLLNHAIWYATKGYDTPYPGERRVLAPNEVPRVEGITNPEEQAMQPFRMSPGQEGGTGH